MSLRLETWRIARRAPRLLGESTPLVEQFFRSRQTASGRFPDRRGRGDWYYTGFGLAGLAALSVPPDTAALKNTLRSRHAAPDGDLVHLCSLARVWAWAEGGAPPDCAAELGARLARYRAADGGFGPEPGLPRGTAYACYLALGAYQDLGLAIPEAERMADCLAALRVPEGGWTNSPASRAAGGGVNPTAAAVAVLRQLGRPLPPETADWLFGLAHPRGGFRATPAAPLPDLLSTATALHALAELEVPLPPPLKERMLDFVDSLWTNAGGFHGHWADDDLDCEYTWYGLLALGHLSR